MRGFGSPPAMAFSSPVPAAERLPVTVLTGYLGAGKTRVASKSSLAASPHGFGTASTHVSPC